MTAPPQPDGSPHPITPAEICALCADFPPSGDGYSPSPTQTAFFTLVWAAKQGCRVDRAQAYLADRDGSLLDAAEVMQKIQQIRQNLAEWGPYLDQLQQKDAKAWELLRIQLEKPLKGYDCRLADKQDAHSNATMKTWELLLRIPGASWLDSFPDAAAAAAALGPALTRIYDFTAPFLAYAGRIARNELLTILQQQQAPGDIDPAGEEGPDQETGERQGPGYLLDWEELLAGTATDSEERQAELREERAFIALRSRLARLLTAIDELPRRQRQVLHLTLGARAQFWRALDTLALPLSPESAIVPLPAATDDEAIARRMGSTENLVRVTRHNAAQRIRVSEIELGELLDRLLAAPHARKDAGTAASPVNVDDAAA